MVTPIGGAAVEFHVYGAQAVDAAQQTMKRQQMSLTQGSRTLTSALAGETRGWESTSVRRAAVRASFSLLSGSVQATGANLAQMLAIISPVGGAIGGLALAIGVELVPSLYKAITGYKSFDEVLKEIKKSSEEAADRISDMSQRRQEFIKISELGARGDFGQINKERQNLIKQIEQGKKDLKQLEGESSTAQAKAAIASMPGALGQTWQSIKELADDAMSGVTGTGAMDKRGQFDIDGLARAIGAEEVKRTLGVKDPEHLTRDDLKKMGETVGENMTPEQMQKFGNTQLWQRGNAIMSNKEFGPQSVDPQLLMRFMAPDDREKMVKEMSEKGGAIANVAEARKKLADQQRNEAKLRQNEVSAMDETLLKDANPREFRRFKIREEAGQRHKFLTDRGVAADDPKQKLVDKLMQRQLDLVDKGSGGIVDASKLHDAIQGQILKDDAGRTAVNTAGILDEMKMLNRSIDELVAHPENAPAVLNP